jgi:hypothetical protein
MPNVGIVNGCLMAFLMHSYHLNYSLLHITGAFKSGAGGLEIGATTRCTCAEYGKFCGEKLNTFVLLLKFR